MLASRLYSPTLREIPADAVVVSHQYMLKAGMMRKISNGLYAFLPLAWRSIRKIEDIIREEMAKIGCQEIMKTSSLMMCALVALTACGTGVKQSVRTPVEMGERIELKTPDPKMGLTINEALAARSSSRDFSPEMLSLEELSGVLWAAAGVNREDGHLTAPSAMALYPIRVYAFLPEGVYRYDSKANVLNRVIEGDRRELTAMQDFAYTAPLNLVYVADYSVYADRNQPVDRIRF